MQISWVESTGRKNKPPFFEVSSFSATAQLQDLTQGDNTDYGLRNIIEITQFKDSFWHVLRDARGSLQR
jgi:hypothetical protein